jgi:hypothetical protein
MTPQQEQVSLHGKSIEQKRIANSIKKYLRIL